MGPIRVLIQGDSHGQIQDIIPKIYTAGEHKIQHVLVVGDFGLWTHKADGHEFLDEIHEAARINNLTVYAIGGNHENWDHWNWFVQNMPTAKGWAMVRRRVLLAPKAHEWSWAGKKFIGAGGAVSVDKQYRLAKENGDRSVLEAYGDYSKGATGPKTLYWPNETLTENDVHTLKGMGIADYLISHDCSNHTPWKTRLKPDADSVRHRRLIDEIIASVKPKFHFHGHMHTQYDWENSQSHGFYSPEEDDAVVTRTIGLEAFKDFNSWGVLEVEEGRWYWPREFFQAAEDRAERKRLHDEARGAATYTV